MDSRLVRIFCANLPSQQARGASYNLLIVEKRLPVLSSVRVLRTTVPFDQSGIHKEPNSKCLRRIRKPRYVRVRNSMIIKAFEKRDL